MSSECLETGKVKEITSDNRAVVQVFRGEACGTCAARGACQTFGGGDLSRSVIFEMDNNVDAQKGDRVEIAIDELSVLKASFVLYFIPAFFLVFGALLGDHMARGKVIDSDAFVLGGAVIGLGAGFLTTYLAGKILSNSKTMIPRISSIVFRSQNRL